MLVTNNPPPKRDRRRAYIYLETQFHVLHVRTKIGEENTKTPSRSTLRLPVIEIILNL